jgi:hypothetical protein
MRTWRPTLLSVVLLAFLGHTAGASAIVPQTAVAGAASKWYSGSLIQQPGQNCDIIGESRTEIMVSGVGSYGGTNGVVKVGDEYWASLLISVPGNPCGSGSTVVSTELVLPRATTIDPTRAIRCFYLPRNSTNTNQFVEVTGQTWSAFGSSGDICPATPRPGLYQGAQSIGYRPIPSGAMLELFVPLKTSAVLAGSGGPDEINWLTDATSVYANPGRSGIWANVFPTSGSASTTPFVYFARAPSAEPFWKADAPVGLRNRAEFWANIFVAGQSGQLRFDVVQRDGSATPVGSDTTPGTGWNPALSNPGGENLFQVTATGAALGPKGGYVPFAYDATEAGKPMRITWRFTPSGGPNAGQTFSGSQDFTPLAGPDGDGDGVVDATDACPAVKGTTADGCLPVAPPDPDGDGIFGADDRCPNQAAPGVPGGCPPTASVVPPKPGAPTPMPPPPGPSPGPIVPVVKLVPPQLVATFAVRRGTRLRAPVLRKGLKVRVTCSAASRARLALTAPTATARRLSLKPVRGLAVVAAATGVCRPGAGVTLMLRPSRGTLARIGRLARPAPATLTASLTAVGAAAGAVGVPVKLG